MKINEIKLYNFRIYKGENAISFAPFSTKNIHIIAGKNGFGKTTFLTSLVWAFYGKLMGQVEDKYRKDIKNTGGYTNYLESLINRDVKNDFNESENVKNEFFVEIHITDLLIPSLPCENIIIKRSYNLNSKEEKLEILIDGIENELTKEIGYDLFINDFILPREVAKFFFFDAEKIVSLAEAKTKDELRGLSKAYSEVLGIKKYEELKNNLSSLLTKLIRKGVSESDKEELNRLIQKEKESESLVGYNIEKQNELKLELSNYKAKSNSLQEKLIREGNSITLEELLILKNNKEELQQKSLIIKGKLNKILEILPLVIAGKKLVQVKNQLEIEQDHSTASMESLKKEFGNLSQKFDEKLNEKKFSNRDEAISIFEGLIAEKINQFSNKGKDNILLDFSVEKHRHFSSVYRNVKQEFIQQFEAIVQEEKNNRILLSRTVSKIKQAESRKNNHLSKKIREEKIDIDKAFEDLNQKYESLLIEKGNLNAELNTNKRILSEFQKKYTFIKADEKKYKVTENLLNRINALIGKIKEEKKYTLQKTLKLSLSKLMHKNNFIEDVKVNISEDLLDIDLIDQKGDILNKDTLSKGEQQLYATALLKALVDESGIQFPVFIDSPLQKFDKFHSKNIIEEFYPSISKQVVLLPLLEKELTRNEFESLQPFLDKSFLIENKSSNSSKIIEADLREEYEKMKTVGNVYSN